MSGRDDSPPRRTMPLLRAPTDNWNAEPRHTPVAPDWHRPGAGPVTRRGLYRARRASGSPSMNVYCSCRLLWRRRRRTPSYVMSCDEHQSRVRPRAPPLPQQRAPEPSRAIVRRSPRSAVCQIGGGLGASRPGRPGSAGPLRARRHPCRTVVLPGWPAFTEAGAMVTI